MQERSWPLSSTPRAVLIILLPFCSKSALVKNKMATLNEHTSVLGAILSDISDHSDTNFI